MCWLQSSELLLLVFFPLLLRVHQIMVVALLVVLIILVVFIVAILLVVVVAVNVLIIVTWHLLFLDCKGWHLNVHRADVRSKRTLYCGNYFHCIGSGFLGSIDSGFWLAATCYCPDSGILASSLLLAVQVFHSIQEGHWCFWLWCLRQCRNYSNLQKHSWMVLNMLSSLRQWPWSPGRRGRYFLSW